MAIINVNTVTGVAEVSHEGCVLYTYEENGYHDSYWFACVWLPEEGCTKNVMTGGTAYAGGASVTVDATPEVKAAYEAWVAKGRAEKAAKKAAEEAALPKRGRRVKVVRGRKVPRGTEGEVIWYGEGKKYSYYGSAPMRVGIKDASGTVHWTAASNVEVVMSESEAA